MNALFQRILLILILFLSGLNCGSGSKTRLHYEINARIEPSRCRLENRVIIRNPPDSCFYLNPDFEIDGITVDGKKAVYQRDLSGRLPYSAGRRIIVHGGKCRTLAMTYSGLVDGVINDVNMVNPDLIELAFYTAWIPLFGNNRIFTYTLKTDIPEDFLVTTNGIPVKSKIRNERSLMTWKSYHPDDDVLLVGSPHFRKLAQDQKNFTIEIYYHNMPENAVLYKKEHLIQAMNRLAEWYGTPQVQGMMRFVYSPRSGRGYSRIPAIVVSEDYGLSLIRKPFGRAHDFHDNVHEMALFWWMIADSATSDDWINEGLAEYSAFLLSAQIFGNQFADTLMNSYIRDCTQSPSSAPIVRTVSNSPDRHVNRSGKTALMFIEAEKRFGLEPLLQTLFMFYQAHGTGRDATTQKFLDLVGQEMSAEAEQYFRKMLYREDRQTVTPNPSPEAAALPDYLYSVLGSIR